MQIRVQRCEQETERSPCATPRRTAGSMQRMTSPDSARWLSPPERITSSSSPRRARLERVMHTSRSRVGGHRSAAAVIVSALLATACAGIDPVVAPMPGCYEVSTTPEWTSFVPTTGVPRLPSVVSIDSNPDRFFQVPLDWRMTGGDYNHASWTEYTNGFRLAGDSVVPAYDRKRRRLAADSLIVSFGGREGGVTAFLEKTPTGFEGQLFSRQRESRRRGPTGRLALTRTACGPQRLVSSRAPNEAPAEVRHWSEWMIPPH